MRPKRALEEVAGAHEGETLLVVSCGPSATLWREVLSGLAPGTVVACVKQAIHLCGSRAALHFFNPFNAQRYWPHNRGALRVDVQDQLAPPSFNSADLVFTLDPATTDDLSRSVASTGRFEDHTIERTGLIRPWGPGIMHEVVFFLANFLGFRTLHTVGWDVVAIPGADEDGLRRLTHFYDPPRTSGAVVETFEWSGQEWPSYRRRALLRHLRGAIYNRMPKADVQDEVGTIIRSLPRLFEWIESEGTSLTVHTQLRGNVVDPSIRPHIVDWSQPS